MGSEKTSAGDEVAELKSLRGDMTQAEFAAELGVTRRTLGRYENGDRRIPPGTMRLARRIAAETRERVPVYGPGPDFGLLRAISEVLDDWIRRGVASGGHRAEMQETIYRLASGTAAKHGRSSDSDSGGGTRQSGSGNRQVAGSGKIVGK